MVGSQRSRLGLPDKALSGTRMLVLEQGCATPPAALLAQFGHVLVIGSVSGGWLASQGKGSSYWVTAVHLCVVPLLPIKNKQVKECEGVGGRKLGSWRGLGWDMDFFVINYADTGMCVCVCVCTTEVVTFLLLWACACACTMKTIAFLLVWACRMSTCLRCYPKSVPCRLVYLLPSLPFYGAD